MTPSTFLWLAALWTGSPAPVDCPPGPDLDRDGVPDACELDLARRFAPVLLVARSACNWSEEAGRLPGAYLFAVHPRPNGYRLAYLPGYLDDCGWSGPKCRLRPRGGCEGHEGDSEIVVVDVARASPTDPLAVERIFLSAHCFGRSDGRCRWYEPDDFRWVEQHPVVWVAEGKNANYPSRRACDAGHWTFDTCDRNGSASTFPVEAGRNIGSRGTPLPLSPEAGCHVLDPRRADALPDLRVCVWSDARFGGWSDPLDGATPYRRYLDMFFSPDEPGGRAGDRTSGTGRERAGT